VQGIDASGRIFGSYSDADFNSFSFTSAAGAFTKLGPGNASDSTAVAISDAGKIVGSYTDANFETVAFAWSKGVLTNLTPKGSQGAYANAVNTAGLVAGYYTDAKGIDVAATWSASGKLALINFQNASASYANAINAAGQIAGTFTDSKGNTVVYLLNPSRIPVLTITGKTAITTTKPKYTLHGTATGVLSAVKKVTYTVGKSKKTFTASGSPSAWLINLKLAKGKTVITIIAQSATGKSKPVKVTIKRK
jgi:probable HAF family extracellular repeat protein